MLHREPLDRKIVAGACTEEVSTPLQSFLFAAAVAGNTVAGAVLLGILLMIPLWLERLLIFP